MGKTLNYLEIVLDSIVDLADTFKGDPVMEEVFKGFILDRLKSSFKNARDIKKGQTFEQNVFDLLDDTQYPTLEEEL